MNISMGKVQSKNVSAYDGAIFLCNRLTRKECFHRKIFGLSSKCTEFIHKVKSGATLFLYDVEQRKLHGVFEATSDGAMNIVPDAYASSGFQYPCQIRFKRIWFCKPLLESEFEDAVQDNYFSRNRFSYGLTHQQVVNLLHLFSSRNRLQPRQNPRLQDGPPRETEISSVVNQTDKHSAVNQTDNQSSSNSSSQGSLKSPCQTCASSTVEKHAVPPSHRLAEPMSLMHSEVQLDISDVANSNSSRSSLHTAANTDIVTEPGTQEAMDDKSTDDYIPLQLEEDDIDGVDNLSDLLGDDSHSSESKGSSDSEEHTTFHQPSGRKKDDFHQPMANSKLRADIEGRKSVFARLMGRPKSFYQREKSKTKSFPPMPKSKSSSLRTQRYKRRRAQKNTPFPCDNRATLDMPFIDKMRRIPALNYSFVWDDDRRSNKFPGGKPSNIQTDQRPYLREDVNEWGVSTKEPDRYDASKRQFVPEGSRKLVESSDRELDKPTVSAEVHESCGVTVKEGIRTPSLDFKRRDKDPNVEGGDLDTEGVEKAARKKTRLASASYHREEYQSETGLVAKDTKPMEILAISDGSCKPKSISLSSNDACTHMDRAYLENEVLLQDKQQRTQGCCEDVTGDKSLILEDFGNVPKFSVGDRQTILNVETRSEVVFGHLETEKSLQEKPNQSSRSCYGVVNTDKMLLVEKPETMDFSPNHDEDCGSKMCLPYDGNASHDASNHLVAEMPPQEKQTPNVQSFSQVVHGDEVLVPENSEEIFPQFDANCGRDKSLSSDEAYNTVDASHLDTHVSLQEKPCQRAPRTSSGEVVNAADQALHQENHVTLDTIPKYDEDHGKNSLSSDGICGYVASDLYPSDVSPDPGSPEPRSNFPRCHVDSANKNILPGRTLEMVSADPQETCKLPQDELFRSISGVTPSVLEYSGTMDTSTLDGDSEHKTSSYQKAAEATCSPTGSENHEDTKPMDILAISDGSCELKSVGLSSNDTCTQMAGAYLETEVLMQDEQQRTQGCCKDVTGDKSLTPEDCGNVDLLPKLNFSNMKTIVETGSEVDVGLVETGTSLQEKEDQSARSCYGVVNTDKMLLLENPETMDLSPDHDEGGILQMLATDHHETFTLPQGEDIMYFCGDTSSVLEYSGTVDTSPVDGGSEHKTSSYQKDAEAMCSPTGSENHEDTKPMDILAISVGSSELKSIGLSSNDTCTQMAAGAYLGTEVLMQDEQQMTRGCCEDVTGDKSLTPEDSANVDLLPKLNLGNMKTIVETRGEMDVGHVETETSLQDKEKQSGKICYGVVNTDKMLLDHNEGGVLQMLATGHHETSTLLPQGEDIMYLCGDTSSVLEYSGTVDTSPVDGGSEHKTSSYQKDAEATKPMDILAISDGSCELESTGLTPSGNCTQMAAGAYLGTEVLMQDEQQMTRGCCEDVTGNKSSSTPEDSGNVGLLPRPRMQHEASFYQRVAEASYLPAGSEDHEDSTNTLSLSRSPPHDQELGEAVPPRLETQYLVDFQAEQGVAHENSDSTDPFAVCGSRLPADSTRGHLFVADLLGTNSESRTGFFDGPSSSELAEMIMLAHDPGEEMEPH